MVTVKSEMIKFCTICFIIKFKISGISDAFRYQTFAFFHIIIVFEKEGIEIICKSPIRVSLSSLALGKEMGIFCKSFIRVVRFEL